MTDYDDYSLYDEAAEPFGETSTEPAEIIDIRRLLIDGLAADTADDDAIAGRPPQDLDWQDDGLCKESDPEAFFPEMGGSTKQAKAVCKRCPITKKCLQYALENGERYGIWGGHSEHQRREILKRLNDMATAGLGRAG